MHRFKHKHFGHHHKHLKGGSIVHHNHKTDSNNEERLQSMNLMIDRGRPMLPLTTAIYTKPNDNFMVSSGFEAPIKKSLAKPKFGGSVGKKKVMINF